MPPSVALDNLFEGYIKHIGLGGCFYFHASCFNIHSPVNCLPSGREGEEKGNILLFKILTLFKISLFPPPHSSNFVPAPYSQTFSNIAAYPSQAA